MTELTRAELAKELGFWPPTAKGWRWGWHRCGRYAYGKRLGHTTNPDHLVPSPPPTGPPLPLAPRHIDGRPGLARHT
jgi:hypothetical protein